MSTGKFDLPQQAWEDAMRKSTASNIDCALMAMADMAPEDRHALLFGALLAVVEAYRARGFKLPAILDDTVQANDAVKPT